MNIIESSLRGVLILEPRIFGDRRGFFLETFRETYLEGHKVPRFVQDNQSRSGLGVLRGLHYQLVNPQGKLVRAATGRIFDVAVDLRRGSSTYGKWFGTILDDIDHRQLYIPPNFAHGFVVLSEFADVVYKCTQFYHPGSETGILWNDPDIAIAWPEEVLNAVKLSDKDRVLPHLRNQLTALLPAY